MTDTPAWLARYDDGTRSFEGLFRGPDSLALPFLAFVLFVSACREIQRLNDRIAVLESGQREMETRLPTEGGL